MPTSRITEHNSVEHRASTLAACKQKLLYFNSCLVGPHARAIIVERTSTINIRMGNTRDDQSYRSGSITQSPGNSTRKMPRSREQRYTPGSGACGSNDTQN